MPTADQLKRSETCKLVFITLLSGALCSIIAFYFSDRKPLMIGDSSQYATLADNLKNHRVLSLENHTEDKPFYPTMARMPGYPLLVASIKQVFGESQWNTPVLNLIAYLSSCIIISLITHNLFGFIPAVITGILTTSHFSSISYTLIGMSESTANLLIIGLIVAYQRHKESIKIKTLALLGFASGIAALYREPVLPTLMIGFMTLGVDWNSSFRIIFKRVALFVACLLVSYSPWIFRNYRLSNQFIPVTIFAKGAGSPVRLLQNQGDLSLMLTRSDWKKIIQLETALFSIISHKTGYPYNILYGNPVKQEPVTNTVLLSDLNQYFPNEMYDLISNDPRLSPTIKCELIYCKFMANATKSLIKNVSFRRKAKTTLIRLLHLYSCNDISRYSSLKPGYYSHKLIQFRWYFIECPLAIIGMACGVRNKKALPYLGFILIYTILIISTLHIEPRYAYLPILFIKIFMGYGLYTLAVFPSTIKSRMQSTSQS